MVHITSDPQAKYKIAVITVLYKIGLPDPFLSKVNPEILPNKMMFSVSIFYPTVFFIFKF